MAWFYQGDRVSRDDMSAKFKDTYVVLKPQGLCYIRDFVNDVVVVQVLDHGNDVQIASNDFCIVKEFPEEGTVINYRQQALQICRVPVRQWKVGLVRSTLRFLAGDNEVPVRELNRTLVKAMYYPDYTTIQKAIALIGADPGASFAISPYYWISFKDKQFVLNRRAIPVGTITQTDNAEFTVNIFDFSCSLEQEIKDEFKDGKYRIKVNLPSQSA